MKPFDLQEAQQGQAIQTRDGRRAQYVTYVPSIGGVIVMIDGTVWTADRQGSMDRENETAEDLFMVGKEKTVWVNLYKAPNTPAGVTFSTPFETEADALEFGMRGSPIATVPVEYVA